MRLLWGCRGHIIHSRNARGEPNPETPTRKVRSEPAQQRFADAEEACLEVAHNTVN